MFKNSTYCDIDSIAPFPSIFNKSGSNPEILPNPLFFFHSLQKRQKIFGNVRVFKCKNKQNLFIPPKYSTLAAGGRF